MAQFNETNGALPDDAEFHTLTAPLLASPIPPQVSLAIANSNATSITSSNAIVSGALTQGVYGDQEASLWVYWGVHDGGTNVQSWSNSKFIAVNTNFNPRTYSTLLTNLLPSSVYYYRFYASNRGVGAWSPDTSQFRTTAPQQAPELEIISVSNGLFLSWPSNSAGFTVYSTANLAPPTLWAPITNQPILANSNLQVSVATNGDSAHYFRLQSP